MQLSSSGPRVWDLFALHPTAARRPLHRFFPRWPTRPSGAASRRYARVTAGIPWRDTVGPVLEKQRLKRQLLFNFLICGESLLNIVVLNVRIGLDLFFVMFSNAFCYFSVLRRYNNSLICVWRIQPNTSKIVLNKTFFTRPVWVVLAYNSYSYRKRNLPE